MLVLYSSTLLFCFLLKFSYLIFSTFFFGYVQTCEKVERKGNEFFWTRHSPSSTNIFASCASSNFAHPLNNHTSPLPKCILCFLGYFNEDPKFFVALVRYNNIWLFKCWCISEPLCITIDYQFTIVKEKVFSWGLGSLPFSNLFCILEFFQKDISIIMN